MKDLDERTTGPGPLLEVRDLVVEYPQGRGRVPLRAVDGVSLRLEPGETLGLVGESGSGKSTIGRAILGLDPIAAGTVWFDGVQISGMSPRTRRTQCDGLQVVFQDPVSSLNPARTIGQSLGEMLRGSEPGGRDEIRRRVEAMLGRVGLPAEAADRYPAHFSGGQRQRIAIARALMREPQLVVCDEAVSALDLSVQAQVMNLLHDLQDDLGLSYLFIAHDLSIVRHVSHRVAVLYRGQIVEEGPADAVYREPRNPYTQALLAAAPVPDPDEQRERRLRRRASRTGAV